MEIRKVRLKRLQQLIDGSGGTYAACARRYGLDATYLSQLMSGHRAFGERSARNMEEKAGLPQYWFDQDSQPLQIAPITQTQTSGTPTLFPGTAPPGTSPILVWETEGDLPPGQYVFVPTLSLELAAGNGRSAVHIDYKKPKAFLSDWIRDRGLKARYLVSMQVTGDSMSPWVNDGDTVVVDRSSTEIRDGKPYAIRYGEELRIKHLHRRFDGGLILRSINRDWEDEVIQPADLEHIEVLGLVVWRAG